MVIIICGFPVKKKKMLRLVVDQGKCGKFFFIKMINKIFIPVGSKIN